MASSYSPWPLVFPRVSSLRHRFHSPRRHWEYGEAASPPIRSYNNMTSRCGSCPKESQNKKSTGKFELYLPETCKFSINSYQLEYGVTVSGVDKQMENGNLEGLMVAQLRRDCLHKLPPRRALR
ncbi:unnamed protein product [Linum trigynum]|uniref:Uncharacterized protein n=1 Tax=Linum trigynum TaxID=586398 RepID=A0AAV2FUZ1_9ROSI